MIRRALRWILRGVLAVALALIGLLVPVGYNELACKPEHRASTYSAILPPEHHRAESRTLMTYPEWHIVHAYDSYARIIAAGDPHDAPFLKLISGFWSSLCALSQTSGGHGGFDGDTKMTIYTIGVSFTAELLAKAAYEETLGRAFAALRGDALADLDHRSARHARTYAEFLQQTPWYKWDFEADRQDLRDAPKSQLRDYERRFALGTEYWVKAGYARVIANAVSQVGQDALTLRMIVRPVGPEVDLAALDGVTVIAERPEGIEIETPRYRALTHLMQDMAPLVDFVEIAGNDDIMLTALSQEPVRQDALHSFERFGYGDYRHLILVRVSRLAAFLQGTELEIEHIHDY